MPVATGGRFAALLSSEDCARPVYDEILAEAEGCVLTPTLGSIVPNWMLIVPRVHSLSFLQRRALTQTEPHRIVQKMLEICGVNINDAIWFEHGPSLSNSKIGCGVDHAHIHLLVRPPFKYAEFLERTRSASQELTWRECASTQTYNLLDIESSYLAVGCGVHASFAHHVDAVGSQFFRRIVAELAGSPDRWNYKTFPEASNAERTIRHFRSARM